MKSNRKIVDIEAKLTPITHTYITARFHIPWYGTAIKVAEVKSALWDQNNISNKFQHSCDGNEYEVKTN